MPDSFCQVRDNRQSFLYFRGPNIHESNSPMKTPHPLANRVAVVAAQDAPLAPHLRRDDADMVPPHYNPPDSWPVGPGEFVRPQSGHPQFAVPQPEQVGEIAPAPSSTGASIGLWDDARSLGDSVPGGDLRALARQMETLYVLVGVVATLMAALMLAALTWASWLQLRPMTINPMPIISPLSWCQSVTCNTEASQYDYNAGSH